MEVEEMEAKIKALEDQVRNLQTLQDIEEIKKLQKAYGYYLEHWMAEEIIDLFSDGTDVTLDLSAGTFLGKEGVKRYFRHMKEEDPEFLHQVMQLSGIVDVNPDGQKAKGRWYGFGAIAMPRGGGVRQSFMSGIYDMEYVKEDGKWKIKELRWNLIYSAPPGEGWVKPERVAAVDPNFKFDSPAPDAPRTFIPQYPSGYITPFHYKHPVTGK